MSTSKFTLAKVLQSEENLKVSELPPVPLLRIIGKEGVLNIIAAYGMML